MVPAGWLQPSLVLPKLNVTDLTDLVGQVAHVMATAATVDAATIQRAFLSVANDSQFSVGEGVAIPHIELPQLEETLVCLATTTNGLALPTLDQRAPDIFWFILSKPDPESHLLLLAHLARLSQSRTLREGLRRARTADEMVALVKASDLRHAPGPSRLQSLAPHLLMLISVQGEKLVDALLVDLVDEALGDACILEAQSLSEAAAREVPLFAEFRDLFGDPGGRRLIVLEVVAANLDPTLKLIQRLAEDHPSSDVHVSALPIQTLWARRSKKQELKPSGH